MCYNLYENFKICFVIFKKLSSQMAFVLSDAIGTIDTVVIPEQAVDELLILPSTLQAAGILNIQRVNI